MKTESQRNLVQYVGHEVIDQNGNKVGKLNAIWSDGESEPVYLGVQTGWLFGKTHVVPAQRVSVNDQAKTIRLPYTVDKIKDAPSYDSSAEIDPNTEREIQSYYNISSTTPARSEAAPKASRPQTHEGATVQLHEEQVKVGKRQVEAGGVRLRKIVRTETVNQPVELLHEEIVVERVPSNQSGQRCDPGSEDFKQEDIFIPLRREEAVVEKQSRVREEVRVSKKPQSDRQTISEQVRKEDVEVQRSGMPPASKPRGTQPSGKKTGKTDGGTRAVFGICRSQQQASQIVDDLKRAGFSNDDISALFPDKRGTKDFAHEKNTKAPEGAVTGAGTGGAIGAILGGLIGAGVLAIPGLGPVIAAGPVMGALSGGAVGAGAGGIIGALIGLGIPEYEAKRYEGKIREGNIFLSVHSNNTDETRRAKEIFSRNGAEDVAATDEEKVISHAE